MSKRKIKFIILSLNGGGIRGLVSARILTYLEEFIAKKYGVSDFHFSKNVDLFAGTSTGSIIALGLNIPDANKNPKYKAKDILDLYLKESKQIFQKDLFYSMMTLNGITGPKYKENGIENVLRQYFGDTSLSESISRIIVPAHNITQDDPNRVLYFFTNYNTQAKNKNYFVRDVARASSAAPTFFPPAHFQKIGDDKKYIGEALSFIDGGVFANNPSLCAFIEAFKINPDLLIEDVSVISFGTGWSRKKTPYESVKNYGAIQWVVNILNILMNNAVEVTEYQLHRLYELSKAPENFIHIDFQLDADKESIDDASDKNLNYLYGVAEQAIQDNQKDLEKIAKILMEREISLDK